MPVPTSIVELVERFRLHREDYLSPSYNETQVRREFVDPFFKALGWDVDNEKGYAERYKEVIHEDSLKVGGTTRAPDYSFWIGETRKFFVETKKPSIDLRSDPLPAFQLRRYAWSAKLPLSILTDFHEFSVYNSRTRPVRTDRASKERVLYVTADEYADRWDEIASLFSREAILRGSFDRFAESKRKRGTAEVDDAFLEEIEEWRELLARNLALRNADLSQRELNFAVQKTIDRIIFLRIAEDRGIEDANRLQGLLDGPGIYPRLCELFRQADVRYNSGLFHFQSEKGRADDPDEWTLALQLDDEPLEQIIGHLYFPHSPYAFAVVPADILGQVYERFLGKVIRLTKGHRAVVDEKPEVRKAGGVYYTPTYVVDYIVDNTLGKLLAGRSAFEVAGRTKTWKPSKRARPLAVLDPACGSGTFLIGAYQYLLDWYRDWYADNEPEYWTRLKHPTLSEVPGSDPDGELVDYRLTMSERKRILLDHVYGVDIDTQAVEVTKLSLLLKVLEGENAQTLQRQLFARERALPDLAENVKCGNALIGPDFFDGSTGSLFDEDDLHRINVFDWHDQFRTVMDDGGFDAVIGNPPYVRMEAFKALKHYLRDRYECHADRADLYSYFIEREHALLRTGGRFGTIVSNKFLRARYGRPLRALLARQTNFERIVDLAGLPVFPNATVRTVVLVSSKATESATRPPVAYSPPPPARDLQLVDSGTRTLEEITAPLAYEIPQRELAETGWRLIRPEHAELMDRLADVGVPLKTFAGGRICRGIVSGLTKAFVLSAAERERILRENEAAKAIIRPFLQGRQVRSYGVEPVSEYLIYTPHGIDMEPYPAVLDHLQPFREKLEKRATRQEWYELQQPQFAYVDFLERPKIVFPDIATEPRFAIDRDGRFGANTVYFLPNSDLALLGLLNSRLAFFFFQQTCAALEGPGESYLRFFGQYLENFPVELPSAESADRTTLGELAEECEALSERLSAARATHDRTALQRRIDSTTGRIDQLVYRLYALSPAHIELVESATSGG